MSQVKRFVIIEGLCGNLLDTPITFTESMIQSIQDLYIRNLIRVCRALKVVKITPHSVKVKDRWTQNPYINYEDKDLFHKLGKSCIKNGMQWLLIIKDGQIFEGIHRIMALQQLVDCGEYTEEELTLPALDISDNKFNEPVKIEFFKFRANFRKVKRYGLATRHLYYNDYSNASANFMAQSAMLKYVYFEWEKKYGQVFPQPNCIMDYDELKRLMNEKPDKD